ncbi:DsrE/DsrF/DrsH-like family protein [Megasphaera vaginalis (ex Srinivasan et al. 2021)]|uniref:DsrE/DsrF-like family protein n=1 Tax=Megasphaera vaginalis (ex Srinivasan et al. 2021) TaxID=1111454 RepID=U7UDI7_9FIRM|nr:DsrE/DsrF/DrsH-like family protein [Megasphaera vaginalis (ex Srinivasan et al. 2021)]ERT56513.1 DsrE/DsrF-like family protein [Megasphaera vaginalis (ex Srinivasan et al. 2021)]
MTAAALPGVKDDKTIIVFSGDFDKVMAAFVIANGALAMGKKVTMFFTFWGLNAIRKPQRTGIRKKLLETMFEWMMPRGSRNLKLSNMNMLGIGTKLMRKIMADKNITSLEELIAGAQAQGVRILACQMSMDAMGLRREELLDGVETVGVGTFLGASEEGNMTLFI